MKETKNTWQQNEKRDFELYAPVDKVQLGGLQKRWTAQQRIVDAGCTVGMKENVRGNASGKQLTLP